MTAYPARMTVGRLARICAWQVLAFLAIAGMNAASGERTPDRVQSLQLLAAHIKGLADQADLGIAPAPEELASLRRQLTDSGRALQAAGDVALERKYDSISSLLARLEFRRTNHATTHVDAQTTPAQVDREIVTPEHGGTCASAFGLSDFPPVEATLGNAGNGQADAWYRLQARQDGYYRVATRSTGPDPSIEILSGGCASLETLASDDDSDGLDAAAAVAVHRGDDLLVHVTNSAQGGGIVVSATTTGGAIGGTVTDMDTGLPLSNVQVAVISTTAYYNAHAGYTDQHGQFLVPIEPGIYYVLAIHDEYMTELYPDAPCWHGTFVFNINGCNTAQATAVVVGTGVTIGGINIALRHGQKISGLIRDQASQPITNAIVKLYDGAGMPAAYDTYTDDFGRYSFPTLIAGAYKLSAEADGHGSQMYADTGCDGSLQTLCDLTKATIVNLTAQDLSGVDFNLPLLATIAGSVTGPFGFNAQVCVVDAQGYPAAQCAGTDGNGSFKIGPLPIGTYYAYAVASGYFSQIFNTVDCPQDCTLSLPAATAITISQTGQAAVANFPLHALPVVNGHVRDAITNLPLSNVSISASIQPPGTYSPTTTTTDGSGNFSLYDTPSGRYYILAQSNDHLDQIYSGIPCEQHDFYSYPGGTPCDVTGAAPLTIAPGIVPPAFDFALQPSSSISGKASIRDGVGADLPATVEVTLYNTAGEPVALAYSDALGHYALNDLPSGTYYAEAGPIYSWDDSYLPQLWQQIDCPGQCAPTMGIAIVVGAHASVAGIDFALVRRDAVVGRVIDDAGAPLAGVIVDLFDASSRIYFASGVTNALGHYAAVGSLGSQFFIATEAGAGYVNQVYANISCPLGPVYLGDCALTGAIPVGLGYASVQPHIVNFVLYSKDTVFASGFEP